MFKDRVHTIEDAFNYITDCNLATVADMAMIKSRKKSEYRRQIRIAQKMVEWIMEFGIDSGDTRATDIIRKNGGDVQSWADQYDVMKKGGGK